MESKGVKGLNLTGDKAHVESQTSAGSSQWEWLTDEFILLVQKGNKCRYN